MNYWMGVATLTGIYMIAILGVSILTGFTGLFSMGHAGFIAIGAYTSALITKTFHVPILVGVFCGMLMALAIGLVIGYPTLKLKGDYFVIATLGIGEVTKLIIENLPDVTGGARGLTDVPKGATFPVVLCFLVVIVWGLRNFLRSSTGATASQCGRRNWPPRPSARMWLNYKMLAMGISCALCGISGALLAHYMHYLNPTMFNMVKSDELVMTVILGGCGSLTGTIIASMILVPPAGNSALRLRSGVAHGVLRPVGGPGDYL